VSRMTDAEVSELRERMARATAASSRCAAGLDGYRGTEQRYSQMATELRSLRDAPDIRREVAPARKRTGRTR
jgi:hypothetical protein